MILKVQRKHPDAALPRFMTAGACGMDLKAVSCEYKGAGVFMYDTGVAVEIPRGYCGLLFPRSSVYKTPFVMANSVGLIDSDYRGSIRATFRTWLPLGIIPARLRNAVIARLGAYAIGERVAQLVITPCFNAQTIQLDECELTETERGEGGHGSTGNAA